jgi:hypothetical protein
MTLKLSLTAKGLAILPSSIYKNDFTFMVGGHKYECPSIIAEFLSPAICRLRETDISLISYTVNTNDSTGEFLKFLSLGQGSTLSIDSSKHSFYYDVCEQLENSELLAVLMNGIEVEMTSNTVLKRLKRIQRVNGDFGKEIEFAASHFNEISSSISVSNSGSISDCNSITFEILYLIPAHPSLKVKDEDWLLSFVIDIVSKNDTYFSLFEIIQFEYLSDSGIRQFVDIISMSFGLLTISIWTQLSNRLILPVSPRSMNSRSLKSDLFIPFEKGAFSGLIRELSKRCDGNVCDTGIVSVSVAHTDATEWGSELNGGDPKVVFDLDSRAGLYDANRDPTWLRVDFTRHRIQVTSYSINLGRTYPSQSYSQQWVLKGSNDGKSWKMLDDRSRETKKRVDFTVETFMCGSESTEAFQSIRLSKKDSCWGNSHQLGLCALEFFGTLTDIS